MDKCYMKMKCFAQHFPNIPASSPDVWVGRCGWETIFSKLPRWVPWSSVFWDYFTQSPGLPSLALSFPYQLIYSFINPTNILGWVLCARTCTGTLEYSPWALPFMEFEGSWRRLTLSKSLQGKVCQKMESRHQRSLDQRWVWRGVWEAGEGIGGNLKDLEGYPKGVKKQWHDQIYILVTTNIYWDLTMCQAMFQALYVHYLI